MVTKFDVRDVYRDAKTVVGQNRSNWAIQVLDTATTIGASPIFGEHNESHDNDPSPPEISEADLKSHVYDMGSL